MKRKAKRITPKLKPIKKRTSSQHGFGHEMPPDIGLVEIYFDQKGMAMQAQQFYDFYKSANWRSPKGTPYRNWKVLATDWIYDREQEAKFRERQRTNAAAIRDL